MRLYVTMLFGLVAFSGCRRFSDDSAQVCFTDPRDETGLPQALASGGPLELFVSGFGGCHTKDLEVRCDVTVDGDLIEVSTETTWIRTDWFAVGCGSILLVTETTCSTPPLDSGTYTLVYGDHEQVVTVPGELDGCAGF